LHVADDVLRPVVGVLRDGVDVVRVPGERVSGGAGVLAGAVGVGSVAAGASAGSLGAFVRPRGGGGAWPSALARVTAGSTPYGIGSLGRHLGADVPLPAPVSPGAPGPGPVTPGPGARAGGSDSQAAVALAAQASITASVSCRVRTAGDRDRPGRLPDVSTSPA
jgi:hypothetical protein